MADFDFSLDDLLSDNAKPFNTQQGNAGELASSRARYGRLNGDATSSTELSTLATGQIMMGVPLFDDPENTLAKQELLASNLLGASMQKEKGSAPGLGVFDLMVPADIQTKAAIEAIRRGSEESTEAPAAGAPNAPTTGAGGDAGASMDAKRLIDTGRLQFQASAGARLARQDMLDGKISPNLIFALSLICQQFEITISCAASDLSGNRNRGHSGNSLHYRFQAVDITNLKDIKTGAMMRVNGPHPFIQRMCDILNTLTGPRRAKEVISPINPGYPGMWARSDHYTHIHIAVAEFGVASPVTTTPPPATSTSSGTRVTYQ